MSRLIAPIFLLSLLTVTAAGCASTALDRARAADELRDYDLAVAEYAEALKQRPGDRQVEAALDRARTQASAAHHLRGRRLMAQNRHQDAALELQIAVELNPTNEDAAKDLRAARVAMRQALNTPREGPTELEALLARAPELKALGPTLPDTKLPSAITTGRQTTSREAFLTLAQVMNLGLTFDPSFRETPAEVRLPAGTPLADALSALTKATATFYRVVGPGAIIVINDTPAKQREYTQEVARWFLIQNADLKEVIDALRIVTDTRAIAADTRLNGFSMRDTPDRVEAAARLVRALDKAKPELVVDVEVLEVNRATLKEYGAQIASPGSPGISGSVRLDREGLSLDDLRNLSRANVLTGGIPALYYRLLKTDSRTRMLANSQVRVSDGVEAKAAFGQDVPIPVTQIVPLQQGGIPIQPQTTFQYKTVGVNITMTPRAHANDDVSLALAIDLSTLAGTLNDLPIIGTRQVTTSIRLRDGETNILSGLIREDERTTKETIPGLGDIPILGSLFARNQRQAEQTDVVILLTPHVLRGLAVGEEDLRPFLLPRDALGGAGLLDALPIVPPPPINRGGGGGPGGDLGGTGRSSGPGSSGS